MKVKIFGQSRTTLLEDEINGWLLENKGIEIIKLEYGMCPEGERRNTEISALILYNDKTDILEEIENL